MYKKAGSRSFVQDADLRKPGVKRTHVRYAGGMKRCTKCGVEQPLGNFYKAAGTRDGLRGDCKGCFQARAAARYRANPEPMKERARRWQAANPERVAENLRRYQQSGRKAASDRRSYLKRKYGVTPEWYDETLAAQGGGCAICGRPPRNDISLHVDHDHATGALRRLLCFLCNNLLGDADDDAARLRSAANYLDRHDPEVAELTALAKQRAQALSATLF